MICIKIDEIFITLYVFDEFKIFPNSLHTVRDVRTVTGLPYFFLHLRLTSIEIVAR